MQKSPTDVPRQRNKEITISEHESARLTEDGNGPDNSIQEP